MREPRSKLIDDIVRDLEPVRPVRLGPLLGLLIAVEAALLLAMPTIWGWRSDLAERLADPAFLAVVAALVAAAGVSAWSALRMSVPGREVAGGRLWAMFAVPVVAASAVILLAPWGGRWPGVGSLWDGCWGCIGVSAFTAVLPSALVVALVARLAPLRTLRVGLFAGLSAFLLGAAVSQLHCGAGDAYHLAFGHYLPVAVLSLIAGVAVSAYLRRRAPALEPRETED